MTSFQQIYQAICTLIPDAIIEIEDLTGTGDHISVRVISSTFTGLSRVKQHKLIYESLKKELTGGTIHAVVLNTKAL
uniref:BolA-like protein n=1 Tax=Paulinella micropora TaxID=1928728 RepID=A0A385I1I7_9EUKA|nr:BolA-like protein [Paulinella micropora]AXY63734.1 BolA-like protein [Paulinella micropora]